MHTTPEYYQSLSLEKLLEVLADPESYHADAVQLAREEVDRRKVDASEYTSTMAAIEEKKRAKEAAKQLPYDILDDRLEGLNVELTGINPLEPGSSKTERFFRWYFVALLFYGVNALIMMAIEARYVWDLIFPTYEDPYAISPLYYILGWVLTDLPLLVGIYLMYKRKISGWIAVSAVFLSQFAAMIPSIYYAFKTETSNYGSILEPEERPFSFSVLIYVIKAALIGVMIWGIWRNDIRQLFAVKSKHIIGVAMVSGLMLICVLGLQFIM